MFNPRFCTIFFGILFVCSSSFAEDSSAKNSSMIEVQKGKLVRIFLQETRKLSLEETQKAQDRLKYFKAQGQNPYVKDLIEIQRIGFKSGNTMDPLHRSGDFFQFGRLGHGKTFNENLPFCQLSFGSSVHPDQGLIDESYWPLAQIVDVKMGGQTPPKNSGPLTSASGSLQILLISENNTNDGFALTCWTPKKDLVWTPQLIERLFDDQVHFED